MNFDNYKFRASAIGSIMSGIPKPLTEKQKETYQAYKERYNGVGRPLTKNQVNDYYSLHNRKNEKVKLTDGAKTYLEKLVWDVVTGRSEIVKTKYTDKGLIAEEKSITLYSKVQKTLFFKNIDRKENDFFTGECDNAKGKIRDIKTSWSYATFPLTSRKIESKLYEWQLQVYMDLWGMKDAELIYCLVDTPTKLINDELKRLDYQFNIYDLSGDVRDECQDLVIETVCNNIFTIEGLESFCNQSSVIDISWFNGVFKPIPDEIRIKIFHTSYNEKMISQAKEMIGLARNYMNAILEEMGENVLKFNELNNRSIEAA